MAGATVQSEQLTGSHHGQHLKTCGALLRDRRHTAEHATDTGNIALRDVAGGHAPLCVIPFVDELDLLALAELLAVHFMALTLRQHKVIAFLCCCHCQLHVGMRCPSHATATLACSGQHLSHDMSSHPKNNLINIDPISAQTQQV